jgi:hypothetical protein
MLLVLFWKRTNPFKKNSPSAKRKKRFWFFSGKERILSRIIFREAEQMLLVLFWKRTNPFKENSPSAKRNKRFWFFSGKEQNV